MNTILNFIFSHLNAIILGVWIIFLIIVAVRFFRPDWIKNISYSKLFFIALGLHVFYALFLTWGQYYVWKIGDATGTYIKMSYFLGYALIHFWLSTFLLFLVSGALYFIFKAWKFYRGGFSDEGPMLLLVLMLISGWPGVLVSIALGFAIAVLFFSVFDLIAFVKKIPQEPILIEGVFIFSTLIALLFAKIILGLL